MSLEITRNNQLFNLFTLYWSVSSALRDIVSVRDIEADDNPENGTFTAGEVRAAAQIIRNNPPLAAGILNDWVKSSNYVVFRMLPVGSDGIGTIGAGTAALGVRLALNGWWATGSVLAAIGGSLVSAAPGIQVSQRRCYPNNALAAIALAGDIDAEGNLVRESQLAEAVLADPLTHQVLSHALARIHDYLRGQPDVRARCATAGEYAFYYGGLLAYVRSALGQRAPVNLLEAIDGLLVNQDNFGFAVALMHDVLVTAEAAMVSRVQRHEFALFTPVNEDDFRMSIRWDDENQVQSKQWITLHCGMSRWTFSGRNASNTGQGGSGLWFNMSPWIDYRTPNERYPAVRYARHHRLPVQMGPSRTMLRCLNVAQAAGCNDDELGAVTLALFAFWNSLFDRRMHMVHLYHFCSDCLFRNYFTVNPQVRMMAFMDNADRIFQTVPGLGDVNFYETAYGDGDGYPRPFDA